MASNPPYLFPALPGAWASTWTLSQDRDLEAEETLGLPKHVYGNPPQTDLNVHPAQMENSTFSDPDVSLKRESNGFDDTESMDYGDEQDSLSSGDFYSFISHEDTDTTLFPSVMSISSRKGADNSEGFPHSLDFSGSSFDCLELSSSVHTPALDDDSLSDDVCFDGSLASIPTHQAAATSRDPSTRSLRSAPPIASDVDERSIMSTPSKKFWSENLSDGHSLPGRREENSDTSSVHSDYAVDYANVFNMVTRLDAGNASGDSVDAWSRSSSRNHRRLCGLETRQAEAQRSILQLSQPDGDNPWTLALEPSLTSTESVAQSSPTSISLSLESSNALNEDRTSMISQHNPPSISSFQSPSSRMVEHHDDDEIRTTRQGSEFVSVYGSPIVQSFPSINRRAPSPPPPFIIYSHNEPARSRTVIQKTKALCSKFKKFVTSKASRQKNAEQARDSSSMRRNAIDLLDSDISPPLPQASSPSLNGHQGFQRAPKLSTTSVPLPFNAAHNNAFNRNIMNVGERHTYEYHARPKTIQEIKSKRRFSLPTFAGAPSNTTNSRPLGPFPANRRRQAGSILSAQERDYTP